MKATLRVRLRSPGEPRDAEHAHAHARAHVSSRSRRPALVKPAACTRGYAWESMPDLLIVGGGRMGEALLGGLIADGRPAEEFAVVRGGRGTSRGAGREVPGRHGRGSPGRRRGRRVGRQAGRRRGRGASRGRRRAAGAMLSVAAGITTRGDRGRDRLAPAGRARDAEHAGAGRRGRHGDRPGVGRRRARPRSGPRRSCSGSVPWCASRNPRSTPSRACRAPARRTCSSSPRRWPTRACSPGFRATSPRRSRSRPSIGAAELLREADDGPAGLRAAVTSPGGTTAAGLRELERHGVRAAFLDAVDGRHRALARARSPEAAGLDANIRS